MSQYLPDWVFELRDRVPQLLASYSAGSPGWYRVCNDGNLVEPGPQAGLGFSCFAAKTAVQCGVWQKLSSDQKQAWIEHIQRFQLPAGPPGYGMFCDPTIDQQGIWNYWRFCLRHFRWKDLFGANWRNRWAETRQAMSTLFSMGAKPLYPVSGYYPVEKEKIIEFCEGLEWEFPWAAGAQVGHLLFFLKHGADHEEKRIEGMKTVLSFLASIESSITGGWYRGQVSNQEIINGAMKIMNGLYWWKKPCTYAKILSRIASQSINASGDCAITNRLFVLYRLSEQLGEIPAGAPHIAEASLKAIPEFFQPDGGLSSDKNGSLHHYYTVKVSLGKRVGDIHALFLFTWAITLSAYLLGEQERLGWKLVAP